MNDITLVSIPFHGKPLVTFQQNGEPYAAMKPIVEGMGLAWQGQLERIKRSPILASTISVTLTVAEDGKQREMVALPLKMLNGWLFGIDVDRVKPELRETILAYQRECYDVLYRYWHEGKAERPGFCNQNTVYDFISHKARLARDIDNAKTPLARQMIFEAVVELHEAHGEPVSDLTRRLHQESLWSEHPVVKRFWNAYEAMERLGAPMNHGVDPDVIAINLGHFVSACQKHNVPVDSVSVLKQRLAESAERKHIENKSVRSKLLDKTVWCWLFRAATDRKIALSDVSASTAEV